MEQSGQTQEKKKAPYNKTNLILLLVVVAVIGMFWNRPEYSPAVWEGDTARSEFLGLAFTLPAGWSRDGDEALRAAEEASPAKNDHWELAVRSGDGYAAALVVEQTRTDAQERMDELGGTPLEPRTIAGAEFAGTLQAGEEDAYTFCRASDGYLVSILITAPAGGDIQPVLDCFAPLA